MGDWTPLQVKIYDCPEDQRAAVLDVLRDYSLLQGFCESIGATLTLGDEYGKHEAAGNESEDLADALLSAAPGATFKTWTDPAYEWLGSGVMYAPGLGRFDFESDATGTPVFDQGWIVQALATSGDFENKIGMPWTRAIHAITQR